MEGTQRAHSARVTDFCAQLFQETIKEVVSRTVRRFRILGFHGEAASSHGSS